MPIARTSSTSAESWMGYRWRSSLPRRASRPSECAASRRTWTRALRLLTTGRRAAVPRHRTLSPTLDWSYRLLSEAERTVLRRLAIFAGGFTLPAASAVIADSTQPQSEIIDQVSELVAKSLVTDDVGDGEPRLRLLDTTRAYAAAKLAESGEVGVLARRHAEYYRDLLAT